MGFLLQYRATDPEGSFEALGTGLRYRYSAGLRHLEIYDGEQSDPLLLLGAHEVHPSRARLFVNFLEKTNQIKALMYSNQATNDLARTLDRAKLPAIIESDAAIARYAYALDLGCFERFEAQFCACFGLGAISLSHIRVRNPDSAYYTGSIVTGSGNAVTVHSGSLAGMLYLLSRKTVQDLIALEFGAGRSFDRTAQSLLSASSVLNIMARALDEGFIPVHKLRGSQSPAEKAQAGTL